MLVMNEDTFHLLKLFDVGKQGGVKLQIQVNCIGVVVA